MAESDERYRARIDLAFGNLEELGETLNKTLVDSTVIFDKKLGTAFDKAGKDVKELGQNLATMDPKKAAASIRLMLKDLQKIAGLALKTKGVGILDKGAIEKTNVALKQTERIVQQIGVAQVKTSLASQNVIRIIQDAPFGIFGIANNIEQLSESFGRMKAQGLGLGATLKATFMPLVSGPMAIPFVISLMTMLALSWDKLAGKIDSAKLALGFMTQAQLDYNDAVRKSEAPEFLASFASGISEADRPKALEQALLRFGRISGRVTAAGSKAGVQVRDITPEQIIKFLDTGRAPGGVVGFTPAPHLLTISDRERAFKEFFGEGGGGRIQATQLRDLRDMIGNFRALGVSTERTEELFTALGMRFNVTGGRRRRPDAATPGGAAGRRRPLAPRPGIVGFEEDVLLDDDGLLARLLADQGQFLRQSLSSRQRTRRAGAASVGAQSLRGAFGVAIGQRPAALIRARAAGRTAGLDASILNAQDALKQTSILPAGDRERLLADIRKFEDQKLAIKAETSAKLEELAARQNKAEVRFERQRQKQLLRAVQGTFSSLAAAAGSAQEDQKEILYVGAVMNAISAGIGIYQSIMTAPGLDPATKIIWATAQSVAVVAALMAQARKIREGGKGGASDVSIGGFTSLNPSVRGERAANFAQQAQQDQIVQANGAAGLLIDAINSGGSTPVTYDDKTSAHIVTLGTRRLSALG